MTATMSDDPRGATNPLFNGNRLRLGVFAINTGGAVMTTAPDQYQLTWQNSLEVARTADGAGFEAIVPLARWRPFGPAGHRSGRVFENFSWTAAIAASTRQAAVMSTCHVSVVHPVMAAKAAATIDHISGGRFAVNIVCGWFKPEIEMFGAAQMGHDERYDYADEWVEVLERLWREEEFDYDGRFLHLKGLMSDPKPLQTPRPALMNAGGSERSKRFVSQHCDIAFIQPRGHSDEVLREQVDAYRRYAREAFGREIQIWTTAYVAQRDSIAEAERFVEYYAVEHGDEVHADYFINENLAHAKTLPGDTMRAMRRAMKAGKGGVPLLGRPEDITDRLVRLSSTGIDGVLMIWMDFQEGVRRFGAEVVPMLEQAGLREAAPKQQRAAAE
jgi:alkanesulfonate monooxygenase SsuD/methylene tetrahydromethanopterin reductase-like flavin-dependent oxidoreductase (luciferase family)